MMEVWASCKFVYSSPSTMRQYYLPVTCLSPGEFAGVTSGNRQCCTITGIPTWVLHLRCCYTSKSNFTSETARCRKISLVFQQNLGGVYTTRRRKCRTAHRSSSVSGGVCAMLINDGPSPGTLLKSRFISKSASSVRGPIRTVSPSKVLITDSSSDRSIGSSSSSSSPPSSPSTAGGCGFGFFISVCSNRILSYTSPSANSTCINKTRTETTGAARPARCTAPRTVAPRS
mmetsp:Transcript_34734/g.60570  ORF Transcript_34734/g.60570 Transcript_34734/m.60570 type:complete len:230 (-) Transcript_34734:95-784(-)